MIWSEKDIALDVSCVDLTLTSFVCVCVCVLPPSVSNPTCRSKPLFGNVFGACMHCTVGEGSDDDEGLNVLRCGADIIIRDNWTFTIKVALNIIQLASGTCMLMALTALIACRHCPPGGSLGRGV